MEDVFERGKIGWEGCFFFENFKNGCNVIIFVVLALTQHAWHAKCQSAATFCQAAMQVFAATTQLSILCHHPFSNTSFDQKFPGHPKVGVSQSLRPDICTKYCDNGFCVDLGYFGHFRGMKFVGGGSQLDRLLLELKAWITAGQVSAGAGADIR